MVGAEGEKFLILEVSRLQEKAFLEVIFGLEISNVSLEILNF